MLTFACPTRFDTSVTGTPSRKSHVACVWRRSWTPIYSTPARSTMTSKLCKTLFGLRMRPLPVQNTRSLSSQNAAPLRLNAYRSLCMRRAAAVARSMSMVCLAAFDFGP
jgi:hypothetical protein